MLVAHFGWEMRKWPGSTAARPPGPLAGEGEAGGEGVRWAELPAAPGGGGGGPTQAEQAGRAKSAGLR